MKSLAHRFKSYTRAWVIIVAQAWVFSCCKSPIVQDTPEGLFHVKRIALEDETEMSIAVPDGYTSINPSKASNYSDFYCTDVTQPEIRKMYISQTEPRSHIAVIVYDSRPLPASVRQNDNLSTQLEELVKDFCDHRRDLPGMPLTEVHSDCNGIPYAYIMVFSRYNSSDNWRSLPLTNENSENADSVECNLIYHTIRGGKTYCVEYYSLESFESFSFMEKRAVLESIKMKNSNLSL